jgi:hypothetical protein
VTRLEKLHELRPLGIVSGRLKADHEGTVDPFE